MNFFRAKPKSDILNDEDIKTDAASVASKDTTSTESSKTKLVKCQKPFDKPVNPIKPPEFDLTDEQQQKYGLVLEHFREYSKHEVPIKEHSNIKHALVPEEIAWLTKECFLRYLRATKWKTDAAIKRIEETIVWRRTFGLVHIPEHTDPEDLIHPELVAAENETGKNLIIGYDNDNRPCLYLRNGYQNTTPSLKQVQLVVFMLERVIQFMPPGQDTLALLIDFKAAPAHMNCSSKFPSISISKQVLHILQHHYPERLGKGLFTNIPWIGYTFFKLVGPFIDPYTRAKTIYDQPFENFVPKEQLDKEFNGMLDFEYVHDIYWKDMNEMADRKHKNYMKKFADLGGEIGMSEYDLRQGFSIDAVEVAA